MARLVITNILENHQFLLKKNISIGFKDYTERKFSNVYLSVHKKKHAKIKNFLELINGDFVAAIGTLIYKGLFEQQALRQLYEDFTGDIEAVRTKAIGNYLIAIKKGHIITIFVDKYQILKTFYYHKNNEWIIANSLADVASVVKDKTVNEFHLIEQMVAFATVEKETVYNDIIQLYGDESILIDASSGKFAIQKLAYRRKHWNNQNQPFDALVNQYTQMVKNRFAIITRLFGENIGLHMTGGIDTRTVFSGFMNAGCKPNLLYGAGDSPITGTEAGDLIACKNFAETYDLNLHVMNWKSDSVGDTSNWSHAFSKYGFEYRLYGANKNLMAEYEGKMPNYPVFLESGYFGENLRLREWAANKKTISFDINDFVTDYQLVYFKRHPELYPKLNDLVKHVENQFLHYADIYQIPHKKGVFSVDKMDELRQLTARKSDSYWVNFCNEFTCSISMLSIYDLHEFPFDVSAEYRKDYKFQLKLIQKLYPDSMKIKVFSHNHPHYYNPKKETLEIEYPYHIPNSIGVRLEHILRSPSMRGLFKIVKKTMLSQKLYYSKDRVDTATELRDFCVNFISQNPEINRLNVLKLDKISDERIFVLMSYLQWLYGINLLSEKEIVSQVAR